MKSLAIITCESVTSTEVKEDTEESAQLSLDNEHSSNPSDTSVHKDGML